MKKIRYIISSTALLLALCLSSNAQGLNDLKDNFIQYNQQVLQEKVFVHTDKNFYLTGEILWFKIYTVDATLNKPLNISKVAYIEVLNNKNVAVLQAKIKLDNGTGNGSFFIPVTMLNGNYKIRAYTNWMRNFSPDYFFEQPISIVNPLITPQIAVKESKPDNDIRFFPEGGNLLDGVKSNVAVKAVGSDGKGIDIAGVVIDQHNDTVARFKSLKYGMGHFAFTPSINNTYKAIIRLGQNDFLIKELPVINKQGYAMQVTDAGQAQLTVSIRAKAAGQNDPVYIFAHSGQFVKVAEAVTLNNGVAQIIIDKSKLGDGVSHITLFNSQKVPVCERLYFKRPKQLLVDAGARQLIYQPRTKVNIDINTTIAGGKPQMADLSLSVYKLDSLQLTQPTQILSYLWLAAELKGNIENADYYLRNATAESDEALDNLLMTQGWSRFKWNDVIAATTPAFKYLPEYNGHLITAKITDNQTGKPAEGLVGYLAATGKKVQLYTATSDATGSFVFNTKDFYGENEVVLQLGIEKDSVYHMEILSPFSELYSNKALSNLNIIPSIKHSLQANSIAMQAQNIYNGTNLKQYYNPGVDSTAFYGKGKNYLLEDYTRFTTMEEVLREYVAEVQVTRPQKHFHIKVHDDQGLFFDGDPLVMLDGVPIFNMDRAMAIDPMKVRKLEDVDRRYYYGPAAFSGILNFTTFKGDLGGFELNPHAVIMDYEGMQLQREFYSPMYDTDDKAKSRVADFRNTLYWLPSVKTGADGKAVPSFYTSDETGKYVGILQGISANGEAGSKYFTFEVEK